MRYGLYKKTLVLAIIVCFIGAGFVPNILTETVKADLTTDLVAWWSFNDGTADDNWGTYHGTLHGDLTYYSTGGPDGSGCFEFDGDGDFITTPLNQLGEQTISLWFKFDSNGNGALISTHIKGDNNGNFDMVGPNEYCGLRVRAIDGWTDNLQAGSPAEYNDDEWHHVAFTHDGGGYYELFVDGGPLPKDTYSGSPLTDNRPYVMGRQEPSSPWPAWLNGMLDEVRIYSRVLTPSEIDQLAGIGVNHPPHKPFIWCKSVFKIYGKEKISVWSIDPDYDPVRFKIDWGDGTISDWSRFFWHNTLIFPVFYHEYKELKTYEIKAKAQDKYGLESDWSDIIEVNVVFKPTIEKSKCYYIDQKGSNEKTLECEVTFSTEVVSYGELSSGNGDDTWIFKIHNVLFYVGNDPDWPDLEKIFIDVTPYNCQFYANDRIAGLNVDNMQETDNEPLINVGLSVASAAVDYMLIPVTGGLPIATSIITAYLLLDPMMDTPEEHDYEWDAKVEGGIYPKEAAAYLSFIIELDPNNPESPPGSEWNFTFDAGATYENWGCFGAFPFSETIRLSKNELHSWPGCGKKHFLHSNGMISISGIMPESPSEMENSGNYVPPHYLKIIVTCPVDVTVYTPIGFFINNEYSTIEGATYLEMDLNGDGELDKEIYIPRAWYGDYRIMIKPQENADPDDTFSIDVISEGETFHLVENMLISEINENEPFVYTKEEPEWGPTIIGSTHGTPDVEYEFILDSTILYGMRAYEYLIDWGDNTADQLVTGPFEAGETVNIVHIWDEHGTYEIRVKVKDQLGQVSEWSESLQVDMGYDFEVSVDIKPGSYPNSINPKSKGNIPVAVLTTDDFNAIDVNPDTVVFLDATPVKRTMEDVNDDGDMDMLFHFKTQECDFNLLVNEGDEYPYAYLTGENNDGQSFFGKDTVNLVPPIPRTQAINRPFLQLLQNFLQQHPLIYQLLPRLLKL